MNIVKGVADLLRRTSGGQTGEGGSWPQAVTFSAPSPRIRFGESGDESVLNTLWQRYEKANGKAEKRKLFQVFLMHFLRVYKNWEPVQLPETASGEEYASGFEDVHLGCSAGHPAEIILVLTQEVQRLTTLVSETQSTPDMAGSSMSLSIGAEGMHIMDALTVVSRSLHNCRVFGYYGGIQKLTALMKAAVVQLKTVSGGFIADEVLSKPVAEKARVLQKILVYVVSVISNFINLNVKRDEMAQSSTKTVDCSTPKESSCLVDSSSNSKGPISWFHWKQKAIVTVLEAGGLNWLVELLRVIKRLSLKEQRTEVSLQYLTLITLRSALHENPRAQNHFRSIGGHEVLLDGISLPSTSTLVSKTAFYTDNERDEKPIFDIFQLQILSLEVLREAVFGNFNNLQFLCENGRVHKFANNVCWPAFMLQELQSQRVESSLEADFGRSSLDSKKEIFLSCSSDSLRVNSFNLQNWNDYVVKLSRVFCSFILVPEDIQFHCVQASVGRSATPISVVYWELSIKWAMKVLSTVFPCIKACSNENNLPSHLRVLANTLQQYILYAFRKILVSSPALLDVFREEGIWDLIFSENFFYFAPALEDFSGEIATYPDGVPQSTDLLANSKSSKTTEVEILQMEVVSFVEFAATLDGNAHNLPECSALLDALEQSACNPVIASVLAKSLHRILQLAGEQTVSSFKSLNANARVLKVACIQAQEYKRLGNLSTPADNELYVEGVLPQKWVTCMEDSLDVFNEYLAIADDAKSLILHNAKCIDSLFDLFWEERLRKHVLLHILSLMKLAISSELDQIAKLQLCCKYLETFTRAKEMDAGFAELSIDLLVGMRDVLLIDKVYYQTLFRDGECFLHIVSLLNGTLDESTGELLVLNVLQTLTCLVAENDASKAAFRALVGVGYQTLQSLLLDFCQWQPSVGLLNALLDMLVDGNFDINSCPVIKNEDVILLFLTVLQKSSDPLRCYGLDIFQQLLQDSITNRASCFRAGMLSFLLDWFSLEENDELISKIAQLIQVIGGYSVSGKDIRKIFALLRSEKIGSRQNYGSLLLTSIHSMLKRKGPTAFFELNGYDSGIVIRTPVHWPYNKGFSFTCWVRVENFPENGAMSLFSFRTENGRGCSAFLGKNILVIESVNQKRQVVALHLSLIQKKFHFLCISHSIGRAFSGGSLVRCYVDGDLVSTEKCRYAKVNDPLTCCSIGMKVLPAPSEEDSSPFSMKDSIPFHGQIGPVYMFGDAISSEHIKGIYSLGPSYMYSFLGSGISTASDNPLSNGIFDAKDGLASKVIFGLNAQASDGKSLFNVSPVFDHMPEKNLFEAVIVGGTKLCTRRLLQDIIYCVGGVSVCFPLLTQFNMSENSESGPLEYTLLRSITRDRLAAEVIELISSVLDENLANQQQMHLLSGFPILGFLLQSVPPKQLNLEVLSALKRMLNVVGNCGLSEMLVKDAIARIYLNPHIWVYADYKVQRELYMFLIQHFDTDARMLTLLCQLPRIIDIIRQFYWDKISGRPGFGSKPLLHPMTREVIGERPTQEELQKIRLLLLSLAEMSLRHNITPSDIKALVAFFERSQDMACIEDMLHMIIRAVSQKQLLASFLEQVNLLGGCHIFVNLLQREMEPIRLLGVQFLGKLLVGIPSEKEGPGFFNLAVGRPKYLSENQRKTNARSQPIFSTISDRLFMFPQTEYLCATLFDVLLGGASPKQVIQKQSQPERQRTKRNSSSSHFFLPQTLVLIFKFLSCCEDASARGKILIDLLDLIDSTPSNIEALMEHGWNSWLETSVRLEVFKNYKAESHVRVESPTSNEQNLVRSLFCSVLSHYICYVKGGWHQLEETVNFLLLQCDHGELSHINFVRDIFEELIERLVGFSSEVNISVLQPCRDNALYLLRLVDEMLISERGHKLLLPGGCFADFSHYILELARHTDTDAAAFEALQGEFDNQLSRNPWGCTRGFSDEDNVKEDRWWHLYDKLWVLISEMNDRGPSKSLSKASTAGGPSFGQRARGLVESLNIPAAEMAAVVLSGGISNALSGKANKFVDKAMLLRGEKFPRIVLHLLLLYLCESSLERASRCVQQFISLLPCLITADDEQSRSKLHLLLWSILTVRSHYGTMNDGTRLHVISQLIRETVNFGKSMLATSIMGRDDSLNSGSSMKEAGSVENLIQKDRVLAAVVDEAKYMKSSIVDRAKQLQELQNRMEENSSIDFIQKKAFEDEIQSNLSVILTSDDNRRAGSQLAYDADQQIVAEKWIHMFRSLTDERGPWSANPFPNGIVTHWKLDKTEDTWRRRPKLKRNYHFDEQLCHPPAAGRSETTDIVNECSSSSGSNIPERMKRFLLKGIRGIMEDGSSEPYEADSEQRQQKASVRDDFSDSQSSEFVIDTTDQDIIQDRKDLSSSIADTETSEVLMSVRCLLVTPKRKLAGHLAIMRSVLHFFGEFLVEGTAGSSVFNRFNNLSHSETKLDQRGAYAHKLQKGAMNDDMDYEKGNFIDNKSSVSEADNMKQPKKIKRHRRWSVPKIKAVHWTRYLLRYTAIEIFFNDSVAPIFFNFASQKDAKDVGTLIVASRNESLFPKGSTRDKNGIISFVDRHVALEMAEIARESWRRRDMSNFEYLMILNTLAGRSYNDLTQYPVFPWVLADYSSEKLDFNKSSTFRDLSKPVGALDSKRFEVFEDRYRNFCDPDIPSFYYGSHYSSMGIVLYYLLRLEPFTALHRNLQGGKFDHADRLFQSIESTYRNCLSNTSDVKELIPEFFYIPEFLVNSNSYHLGVKQDGEPLGDVTLPPWAKGSPEEFIYRNREALESEYVSSNLHHWIDLVFGYKQRGKPAVEAANIFYYLTYEGAVDLETMDDELQRSAIEDQIANFGQTPIQIFRKKHPRRGPPIPITHPLYFAPASITLSSIISHTVHPPSAVLFVGVLDSNIILVNQGLTMSVKMWLTTQLQSGGNFTFSGSQDPFFGIGSDILSPCKISTPLAENIEIGKECFSILQIPSENFLVTCGNWENSFQVISLNDGRMVQTIRQHKDVVSCIAVSSDGSVLATGSYDTTVMVWDVSRLRAAEKRVRNAQTELSRKDYVIVENPIHILCGHDDIITCLFVSVELDIVISGSKDGTCIFHTLRQGRYVRSIQHPSGSAVSKLVASQHGHLVFYASNDLSLHLYSINGKHIASAESIGRLNCVELSCCGEFLVCAGDQGQIVLRSMHSLEVVRRYDGIGKVITSLTVTPEECFLAGTKDGSLLVYSIENPQLRKNSIPRNVKSKSSVMG